LEQLKSQMRVEEDTEDALICNIGITAENTVINQTRRTVAELKEIGRKEMGLPVSTTEDTFPPSLKTAMLMLASHLYKNRESVSAVTQTVVPMAYDVLLKPYRKL